VVTVEDIRRVAMSLPRTHEALVRDRIKFRIGRIVYVALSRDEQMMGCGFPREERAAMIDAQPDKFVLPKPADLRYQWIEVRMAAIGVAEMQELITDAWRMCVPRSVSEAQLGPGRARDAGQAD
jgi:hypothetical protein